MQDELDDRLRGLQARLAPGESTPEGPSPAASLEVASDDELFDFINTQFGRSHE